MPRTAGREDVRFRSVRQRLLLVLTPVLFGVVALVAIGVGRTSRMIAQPIVLATDEALVGLVVEELRRDDRPVAGVLRSGLPEGPRAAFILTDGGRVGEVVGHVEDPDESARLVLGALNDGDRVQVVRGLGPIRVRFLNGHRVDEDRVLILERRIAGLGTRFTTAVIALTTVVVVVGLALPAAIVRGLYGPLVERLETIEQALSRYGAGDTDVRLGRDNEARDEFDQVFEAFDEMAERIGALERERRDRDEAERALLADLAHDVNTPVTVLRGWAETLLERGGDLTERELRGIHGELLGQSLYVEAIVDDLLTLANARSARLELAPVNVQVDPMFDSIVDGFAPMAEQRGVAVIGDGGGITVWSDPVRLRQMLTNLVRNAMLHATGASVIELSAERRDSSVVLAVTDDGDGVPDELVSVLFERHRRGSRSDSGGWGLGLAIVAMLAELHGGRAGYVPADPGSRFEIWLPDQGATDAHDSGR